ncbi:MAG: DEAD/DEAH box helicase [Anaerolineae bacterium]|nr:DEAD/DEAH box helicase [Anaerolineae bacterium]
MSSDFQTLGLHPELLQAVTEMGYEAPTSIQEQAIPALLAGGDIMGQAQTGTGKTAAFALPMLHTLNSQNNNVQGVVVAPTRELANQVARAIHEYGQYSNVRVLPVYGGQAYSRQIRRLQNGVDIVVGTPGRMLDLIRQKALDLSAVRFLVLDEADEMLSMGFIEDIEAILSEMPTTRQTALFSATLPAPIRRLADRYMRSPESIIVNPEHITLDAIEQRCYLIHEADKLAALNRLLEIEEVTSALIFTRTKVGAADLAEAMLARGIRAEALHGDLSQAIRETVLQRFRQGHVSLLVATDVAARGLDIDDVSHVINYDLPLDPEQYVHRIGRTGRAGKTGIALSLVTPDERWRLRRIEKFTRTPIPTTKLPTPAQIQNRRDERFLDHLADELSTGDWTHERAPVAQMVEAGCDPLDIAAAAIQLTRAGEKQRPIEEITEVVAPPQRSRSRQHGTANKNSVSRKSHRRDKKGHEPGMVRFTLNIGRAHNLRPGEIVGAIAGTANIPGASIGAIDIQKSETYVDVAERHASRVQKKMRGWKLRGQAVKIQRVEA